MFDVGKNPTDACTKGKPAQSADGTDIPERAMRGLTDVFKGLADRSRLQILFLLAQHGEMHVSALGDELGQSQPAVSHHLNQLKKAGLIDYRRAGKFNYYRLAPDGLDGLAGELFPNGTAPRLAFGPIEVVLRRK
jgi:ArsR family transcriptional regulator